MYFSVYFGLCLVVLSAATEEIPQLSRPLIRNATGRYLNNPGLTFHPTPNPPSTLIRYNKGRRSTFRRYIDDLNGVLSAYRNENQQSSDQIDCSAFSGYRPRDTWNKTCRFDITDFGRDCVNQLGYGYEDGQPCILFNLERVFRWLPVPYDIHDVPSSIRGLWSPYMITLKCEGADQQARENIGDLTYYPQNGFHFKYFPDMGQPDWKPPLVFVMFENPMPMVLIRVECTVYASNIWHSRILNTGMTSFELQVN